MPAEQDSYDAAREIALRHLTAADRTEAELHERLVTRGVDPQVAEVVVARFVEVGLVDDEAFARQWVTSRHAGRGLSRRSLERELASKGVEPDLVEEALSAVDSDSERQTAQQLVIRKARGTRHLDEQVRTRRLVGMLARKGYSPDVAFDVVKAALAAESADVDSG